MKNLTSFVQKQEEILKRLRKLGVHERDVEESFIRSSGPGGQNVNKVATCVCLQHRPSNIVVKCQRFRVQSMNRLLAWRLLLEKLEIRKQQEDQLKIQTLTKSYRQKRKRPRFLQEKILEKKRIQSQKKSNRHPIKITHLHDA